MSDVVIFDEKEFLADPLTIKAGGKDFIIPDAKLTTDFSLRQIKKINARKKELEAMGDADGIEYWINMQCEFISDTLSVVDTSATPDWVRENISSRVRTKLFEHIQAYQQGTPEPQSGKNESAESEVKSQ